MYRELEKGEIILNTDEIWNEIFHKWESSNRDGQDRWIFSFCCSYE